MPHPTLRPLALGELLDVSFALYRELFGSLVIVGLVTGALPLIVDVYIEQRGGPASEPILWFFNLMLSMILGAIGVGASTHIVSDSYLGERLHAGAALGRVVPYVGRLIALTIMTGFLVFCGLVLLIIPGIIIACGLALGATALVLEGLPSPGAALQRSWALTRGYRGKVFLALMVTFLLLMIPAVGMGVVSALLGMEALFTLASVILGVLISPFIYVTVTVLYYDLRIRQEGLDLEMLSQHLRG
ncbi:MAG TPA: hypothetical protein VGA78_05880 [Gemmatimonadales bacterium]